LVNALTIGSATVAYPGGEIADAGRHRLRCHESALVVGTDHTICGDDTAA